MEVVESEWRFEWVCGGKKSSEFPWKRQKYPGKCVRIVSGKFCAVKSWCSGNILQFSAVHNLGGFVWICPSITCECPHVAKLRSLSPRSNIKQRTVRSQPE